MPHSNISSGTSTSVNVSIDTDKELSSTSVQDLMKLINSLYKIIEGLNSRLERFENLSREVSRVVDKDDKDDKEVSDVVTKEVTKEVPSSTENIDINVTTSSKSVHQNSVHENVNPSRCLNEYEREVRMVDENVVKAVIKSAENDVVGHSKSAHEILTN